MKITRVTPYLMQAGAPPESAWGAAKDGASGMSAAGSRHWCFVQIETDAGITGLGEGSGWPRLVAQGIADLGTLLIGEDPQHIDRLWHKLFVAQMGHGQTGTPGGGALSAIDMALWDLNGKALGVPVWRLLGGRFRERIPIYVHTSSRATTELALAEGVTALKTGNTSDALAKVTALREQVGPDIDLAVDLHGSPWLTAADACRMARALEHLDLLFLEDPVCPEDVDGLRRVRDHTILPLAAGERLATLWGYKTLLGERLVDIVQPDTGRCGGLTQMKKIAALAEANGVMVAPHAGTLGPVAEYAAVHLLASIPNALILERFLRDWPGRDRVATPVLQALDGHLPVPDAPGLGVELVVDEVLRHPSGVNVATSAKIAAAYEPGTAGEHVYVQTRRRRAARYQPGIGVLD